MPAITNITELQNMNLDLTGTYWLANDIDASATSGWNGGLGFDPIGDLATMFTGDFDGRGYTISNLTINRPLEDCVGLFGCVDGSTIEDVTITGSFTGLDYVGGVAGWCENSTFDLCITNVTIVAIDYAGGGVAAYVTNPCSFSNCSATGDVSAVDVPGGFAGDVSANTTFTNCFATGNVTATEYAPGGFAGEVYFGTCTFTDCYATGNVSCDEYGAGGFVGECYQTQTFTRCYAAGDVSGEDALGGFVGGAWDDSTFVSCYATGSVTGTVRFAGGFCGYGWESTVYTECYATGNVSCPDGAGGFVGELYDEPQVSKCFATGDVTCDYHAGGFAGAIWSDDSGIAITNAYAWGDIYGDDKVGGFSGALATNPAVPLTLTNCYSVGAVSGNTDIGGLVGKDWDPGLITVISCYWDTETSGQATSAFGTGKTTAEMMVEPTFIGYDFVSTWEFVLCRDYPVFQYQSVICTFSVDFTREPTGNVYPGDQIKFTPELTWI